MSSISDIISAFGTVNITPDVKVSNKCIDLCSLYNLSPLDLVDYWLAFSASYLSGAPPTLETLQRLELKELKSRLRQIQNTSTSSPQPRKKQDDVIKKMESREPQSPAMEKFSGRTNSGTILREYLVSDDSFKTKSSTVSFTVSNLALAKEKYGYLPLISLADVIHGMQEDLTKDILSRHKLTEDKLEDNYEEVVICGRVYPKDRGALYGSLVNFDCGGVNYDEVIKLNLSKIPETYLFSGESVVVKGTNREKLFIVKELYKKAELKTTQDKLSDIIHIMVASGPYTFEHNVLYEPLEELLTHALEFKPNLLILMGPFVETDLVVNESYEALFDRVMSRIWEKIEGSNIQVIVLPSAEDPNSDCIFPTPPYKTQISYNNIFLAPNPLFLDIQGFQLAASCSDILIHLSKSECHTEDENIFQRDKISRLISHLLNQRSFYPLYPAECAVDQTLLSMYGRLRTKPHLILLPSVFQNFIKVVDGCVVVNPERVIKGNGAGAFAKIEIRPGSEPVSERISCQIVTL